MSLFLQIPSTCFCAATRKWPSRLSRRPRPLREAVRAATTTTQTTRHPQRLLRRRRPRPLKTHLPQERWLPSRSLRLQDRADRSPWPLELRGLPDRPQAPIRCRKPRRELRRRPRLKAPEARLRLTCIPNCCNKVKNYIQLLSKKKALALVGLLQAAVSNFIAVCCTYSLLSRSVMIDTL